MGKRLQKILAESGLMSRRKAESAILAGRVSCNGKVVSLGDTAEDGAVILLDGKPIPKPEPKHYYALNKPRGYVCTLEDEEGRKTVRELLPASAGRVYPVGRLDLMSEGLLLMTNDGDFAFRLTHPSGNILKTYRVTVDGPELDAKLKRLTEPFFLDEAVVQAVDLSLLERSGSSASLEITIGEGRNREIRRMCEMAGIHIKRLIRVREGEIRLGDLRSGCYRDLTEREISSVLKCGERK